MCTSYKGLSSPENFKNNSSYTVTIKCMIGFNLFPYGPMFDIPK